MTVPLSDAPITVHCATCGQAAGWVDCPTGGWWAHHIHPADGHDAVASETELIEEIQRLRAESEQHIRAQVADDIDAFARAAGRAVDPMKVGYLGGMAIAATIARGEHPGFAKLTADLRDAAPADPCGAEPVHQAGHPAGGAQ